MSTINSKNVQVGTSGTASQNFTLYQPATPDGTVRLGVGNSGATTLDAVTVTSAGNVGIGVSSIPSDMRLYTRSATATGKGFYSDNGVNSGYVVQFANNLTSIGNDFGNPFAFLTGNTERMRLDASGNVGIGTSSPASQLDVSRSGDAILSLTSAGVQRYQLITRSGGRFDFQDQSAGATRWSVDQSGNLLVGTTSSSGSGGVTSGRQVLSFNGAVANGLYCDDTRSSSGLDTAIIFGRTSTIVGRIETSLTATTYGTSSDYRLKENVQPMTGALAKVAALKPCTYTWKSDSTPGQGFIAHELQEVCPDAVTGEKDAVDAEGNIVPQGIDTSFLVATLTAAIQEQQAIIESLTARIAALEAK